MKHIFKRLFCKHDYYKADWEQCYDEFRNMRYSRRLYICIKCGKSIWVDGRYDKIDRP